MEKRRFCENLKKKKIGGWGGGWVRGVGSGWGGGGQGGRVGTEK